MFVRDDNLESAKMIRRPVGGGAGEIGENFESMGNGTITRFPAFVEGKHFASHLLNAPDVRVFDVESVP